MVCAINRLAVYPRLFSGKGGEDRPDSKDRLDSIGDRATAMSHHWLSRSEVLASLT